MSYVSFKFHELIKFLCVCFDGNSGVGDSQCLLFQQYFHLVVATASSTTSQACRGKKHQEAMNYNHSPNKCNCPTKTVKVGLILFY